MIPNTVNLPTIWRGCDWGPVTLRWKNADGTPFVFPNQANSRWYPLAQSLNINLNAAITDRTHGVTQIVLTSAQTKNLKLGVEKWDWIWKQGPVNTPYIYPPFLTGKIAIKDPISNLTGDTPPGVPDEIEPPESPGDTEPPNIDMAPELPT